MVYTIQLLVPNFCWLIWILWLRFLTHLKVIPTLVMISQLDNYSPETEMNPVSVFTSDFWIKFNHLVTIKQCIEITFIFQALRMVYTAHANKLFSLSGTRPGQVLKLHYPTTQGKSLNCILNRSLFCQRILKLVKKRHLGFSKLLPTCTEAVVVVNSKEINLWKRPSITKIDWDWNFILYFN